MALLRRFVEDDENTEGDVALERLINRMIRALVKTKSEVGRHREPLKQEEVHANDTHPVAPCSVYAGHGLSPGGHGVDTIGFIPGKGLLT